MERSGRAKGSRGQDSDNGNLTPDERLDWLHQEVVDATREAELRVQDATAFVMDYVRGRISPDEASRRALEYEDRWKGDALGGIYNTESKSDAEIRRELDDQAKWRREQSVGRGASR